MVCCELLHHETRDNNSVVNISTLSHWYLFDFVDSQSYQDVETAGGSPPDALKLDDDSEFPPMSPHDS